MAKKKVGRRYITAQNLHDGREWQYSVPNYLGKVSVGDTVVVGDARRNECGLATVVSVDPCATHRADNIWPIVDKVKTKRWLRSIEKATVRAQLMTDMASRQCELDALGRYADSAQSDPIMKDMLTSYSRLD